jgi:hypothetical protein
MSIFYLILLQELNEKFSFNGGQWIYNIKNTKTVTGGTWGEIMAMGLWSTKFVFDVSIFISYCETCL